MLRRIQLATLLFVAGFSGVSYGQNPVTELYGKGVHAYFSNDSAHAQELLTQAISTGSEDPRLYYFRGLVAARQGGSAAGLADFQRGAELEAAGKVAVNVNRSLERIQGGIRILIEKERLNARLNASTQAEMAERARMSQLKNGPNSVQPLPAPGEDLTDPFVDEPEMIKGDATDMPETSDAMNKPADDGFGFGDDESGAGEVMEEKEMEDPASDGDIFGGSGADEPAADDDDIFGGA